MPPQPILLLTFYFWDIKYQRPSTKTSIYKYALNLSHFVKAGFILSSHTDNIKVHDVDLIIIQFLLFIFAIQYIHLLTLLSPCKGCGSAAAYCRWGTSSGHQNKHIFQNLRTKKMSKSTHFIHMENIQAKLHKLRSTTQIKMLFFPNRFVALLCISYLLGSPFNAVFYNTMPYNNTNDLKALNTVQSVGRDISVDYVKHTGKPNQNPVFNKAGFGEKYREQRAMYIQPQ